MDWIKWAGYFIGCYVIGWFMTGYMVARLMGKMDIRKMGSGNIGARNVGRLMGKTGFLLTFLGDGGKGALAVWGAVLLHFPNDVILFSLFFVIVGHIWPLPFRFHGGKGVATLIGGLLVLEPLTLMMMAGCFVISYLFIHSFTISGLISIVFLPLFYYLLTPELHALLICILIAAVVIWAHRHNLNDYFSTLRKVK